jgi:hypothetical protein
MVLQMYPGFNVAVFLGDCQARKNVSFNWDDDALIGGPRRSLLATRTVSGKVSRESCQLGADSDHAKPGFVPQLPGSTPPLLALHVYLLFLRHFPTSF